MENLDKEQPLDNECKLQENNSLLNNGMDTEGSLKDKFKNSTELLKAYENLEKEFTKKCQRVKELEKAEDNDSKAPQCDNAKDSPNAVNGDNNDKKLFENKSQQQQVNSILSDMLVEDNNNFERDLVANEQFLNKYVYSNLDIKNQFITKYLNEIQSQQSAPLIVSSSSSNFSVMPKNKPRSIKDAGAAAKDLFNN